MSFSNYFCYSFLCFFYTIFLSLRVFLQCCFFKFKYTNFPSSILYFYENLLHDLFISYMFSLLIFSMFYCFYSFRKMFSLLSNFYYFLHFCSISSFTSIIVHIISSSYFSVLSFYSFFVLLLHLLFCLGSKIFFYCFYVHTHISVIMSSFTYVFFISSFSRFSLVVLLKRSKR